jgi:hypothetical protein
LPGTRPKICDELEEADLGNLGCTSIDSGKQGPGDGEFRKGFAGAVARPSHSCRHYCRGLGWGQGAGIERRRPSVVRHRAPTRGVAAAGKGGAPPGEGVMLGEGAPSPPAMEECRQEREGRRPSGEGAPSRRDMRERRGFSFF